MIISSGWKQLSWPRTHLFWVYLSQFLNPLPTTLPSLSSKKRPQPGWLPNDSWRHAKKTKRPRRWRKRMTIINLICLRINKSVTLDWSADFMCWILKHLSHKRYKNVLRSEFYGFFSINYITLLHHPRCTIRKHCQRHYGVRTEYGLELLTP